MLTKRLLFLLFFPLCALLTFLASRYPTVIETYYSTGLYPVFAQRISRFFGWIPFSVTEWILLAAVVFFIAYTVITVRKIRKNTWDRKGLLVRFLTNLAVMGSFICLFFTWNTGLNYYRYPFSVYSGLEIRPSSSEELAALCEDLIQRTNLLREQVQEDEKGNAQLGASVYRTAEYAQTAFDRLSEEYAVLAGKYGPPKPVFFSNLMSYTNITGFFFPYTFEANVNVHVPDYSIPATMCHELSHLRGFMREDEANFIAYLACLESEEPDLQYSGMMLALVHSMNSLYAADREQFSALRSLYAEGVSRDLEENSRYWDRYDGTVAKVSDKINDTYLKVNQQSDGVKSYGRMVDLLLADYRARQEADISKEE